MVARKMRDHCATCGVRYPAPRTWAYCSKACENGRRGRDPNDSGDADAHLVRFTDEQLRLHRELEDAMPNERGPLLERLSESVRRERAMRESITAKTEDLSSLSYWSPILRRECDSFEVSLRRSIAAGIRLGARLVEAKAALPHGEFGRLFMDHDDAVPNALPFTRRWGGELMAMASNDAISEPHEQFGRVVNGKHASHLPVEIGTVALLARVPSTDLQAAIQAGSVGPKTTRGDARRLLTGDTEPSEPETADLVAELLGPINARLVRFAADHPELLSEAAARLKGILRGIARVAAGGGAT